MVLSLTLASVTLLQFDNVEQRLPLPFETTVLEETEDEDHFREKQKWIEDMHLSAPDDNWRLKDQMYRFQTLNTRNSDELPVYGKWRELGSNNQAGRTVFTYYEPQTDILYVAADGGQIWKATLGSEEWFPVNDHFKIPAIRLITRFNEPGFNRLLVHSAAWNNIGILYSDDDGINWSLADGLDNIAGWGFIKRTVVKPNNEKTIYCIAQEWDYNAWKAVSRLYKSTDLGESFNLLHTFDSNVDYADIWTSGLNDEPVYIVFQNTLYYVDEEDNLYTVSTLPNAENGNTLLTGFDTGNGCKLYTMINYSGASHFYASTIDGMSWEEKGTNSQGPFMTNSFLASSTVQDVLYFGGVEAFYSLNAGVSWTKVNNWGQYYSSPEDKLHADIPSFNSYIVGDGFERLFINTDGGTYVSFDQMENVLNLSLNNLRISQYYSTYTCRFDPAYTHAGSQDQGYQRSVDGMNYGPVNYDQVISGDYGNLVSGDGGASIWMVYPGFAMYGPDINNTNTLILEDFVGSGYQWLPKLMDDPDDPEKVYLAGGHISEGTHIMHLERNFGNVTYTELPFDFSNGGNPAISAMAYSKINNDYRYVLTTDRDLFYSTDAGNSWTLTEGFEGPEAHYFYGASIAPANQTLGLLYVAGSGYSGPGVFKSTDNGVSFVDFAEGLPESMVYQVVLTADDSLLFAATAVGAFVCKTWEGQWYSLADGIVPDQAFWAVDYVDTLKVMRFSTYGRGVWDFQLNPDVIAGFVASDTNIITNESVDFTDLSEYRPVSWNWYFEGGEPETSTEQNPQDIFYNVYGNYDVRLIVSNNHSVDTILKENYIHVGAVNIETVQTGLQFSLYPNPAKGTVKISSNAVINEIRFYTSQGILCKRLTGIENTFEKIIGLEGLEEGTYFVMVLSGRKTFADKLIVL